MGFDDERGGGRNLGRKSERETERDGGRKSRGESEEGETDEGIEV